MINIFIFHKTELNFSALYFIYESIRKNVFLLLVKLLANISDKLKIHLILERLNITLLLLIHFKQLQNSGFQIYDRNVRHFIFFSLNLFDKPPSSQIQIKDFRLEFEISFVKICDHVSGSDVDEGLIDLVSPMNSFPRVMQR